MSKTIDEKVVSMEFDNSKFEKNVATTMSTLEKLKASLNFKGVEKGFENISSSAKKVDMNPLSQGIDSVKVKFSAMEVIATTALANITNSAVNTATRLAKSLSVDNIAAGWQKFSDKTTSVATLVAQGNAIEDVNTELSKLNWYTDETSYNFTDMVSNIAKFTATGKGLEESVTAMQGIANWAALSGQNASTASRAMYQISQAMGAGTMRLEDYRSIQNASMDTDEFRQKCLDAAVALGTLEKTSDDTYKSLVGSGDEFTKSQFASSLTEGAWLTSDVMMDVFTTYSKAVTEIYAETEASGKLASEVIDEIYTTAEEKSISVDEAIESLGYSFDSFGLKAFEAAQKARTWSDVVDSVKDAVSTGWMNTFEILIGNAEEATEFFTNLANNLWDLFAGGAEGRNAMLESVFNSKWDTLISKIEETGIAAEDFEESLKETAKAEGVAVEDMIEEYGSLEDAIKNGAISKSTVLNTIKNFSSELVTTSESSETATKSLEELQSVVNKIVRGELGSGSTRISAIEQAGFDAEAVQTIINKLYSNAGSNWSNLTVTADDLASAITNLTDTEIETLGYTEEQVQAIRALADASEDGAVSVEDLIDALDKPSGRELFAESINNTLENMVNILASVKEGFSRVFTQSRISNGIYSFLQNINALSNRLYLTDEKLEKLSVTCEGLAALFDVILDITRTGLNLALKVLGKVLGVVDDNIWNVGESVGELLIKFRNWWFENDLLNKTLDRIADGIVWILESVRNLFTTLYEIPVIQKLLTKLKSVGTKAFSALKNKADDLTEGFSKFLDTLKSIDEISLESASTVIKSFMSDVLGSIFNPDDIVNKLNEVFDAFRIRNKIEESVKEPLTGLGITLDNIKEKLTEFAASLGLVIDETVNWGDITTVVLGGALVLTSSRIGKAFANLSGPLGAITTMFKSMAGAFTGIKTTFNARAVLILVKAVVILVGAVAVLAFVPQENIWSAVGAIAVITVLVAGMALLMAKLKTVSDTTEAIKGCLAFAGVAVALFWLTLSLQRLTDIKYDGIADALISIGSIVVMLVGLSHVVSKGSYSQTKTLKGTMWVYVGAAAAIYIMAVALEKIGSITDEKLWRSVTVLTILIACMTLISFISGKFKMGFGAGAGMLSMASSLLMLALVMKALAAIDFKSVEEKMNTLLNILGIFALLSVSVSFVSKNAWQMGLVFLGMSVAIGAMVLAIKALDGVGDSALKNATSTLVQIIAMFSVLTASTILSGQYAKRAALTIVAVAAAMLLIAGAINFLKNIPEDELKRATNSIVWVLGSFAAIIAATGFAKASSFTTVALVASSIGILAVILATLSNIPAEELKAARNNLIICMGVLAVLITVVGLVGKALSDGVVPANFNEKVLKYIGISALIVGLGVALGLILWGMHDLEASEAVPILLACAGLITALSVILIALAKLSKITDIKAIWKSAGLLGAISVAMIALAWVVSAISGNLNIDSGKLNQYIKSLAAISGMMLVMTAVLVALQHFKAVPTTLTDLGFLSGTVAIIGAAIGAMIGLAKLVDLAASSLTMSTEQMTNIIIVMTAIIGFITVFSTVIIPSLAKNQEALKKLELGMVAKLSAMIGTMIVIITAFITLSLEISALLLAGLSKLDSVLNLNLVDNLNNTIEIISKVADVFVTFIDKFKSLDFSSSDTVLATLTALMSGIMSLSIVASAILLSSLGIINSFGDNTLLNTLEGSIPIIETIARTLASFVTSFMKEISSVSFDEEQIDGFKNIIEAFMGLLGGMTLTINGQGINLSGQRGNIKKLGKQISSFVSSMITTLTNVYVSYSDNSDIFSTRNIDHLRDITQAALPFAELAETIAHAGVQIGDGAITLTTGNIKKLGKQISSFVKSMVGDNENDGVLQTVYKAYSSNSDIFSTRNIDHLRDITQAALPFAKLADTIAHAGVQIGDGAITLTTGNIRKLGRQINSFVKSMVGNDFKSGVLNTVYKAYSSNSEIFSTGNIDHLRDITQAAIPFAELADTISHVGVQIGDGAITLTTSNIKKFGDQTKSFIESILGAIQKIDVITKNKQIDYDTSFSIIEKISEISMSYVSIVGALVGTKTEEGILDKILSVIDIFDFENDFDYIKETMQSFGDGVVSIVDSMIEAIDNINRKASKIGNDIYSALSIANNIALIAQEFAIIAEALPQTTYSSIGGIKTGETDYGSFGSGIVSIVNGVGQALEAIVDNKYDKYFTSSNETIAQLKIIAGIGTEFSEMAATLGEAGDASDSLPEFSEGITEFLENFKVAAEKASEIDEDDLTKLEDCIRMLKDIASSVTSADIEAFTSLADAYSNIASLSSSTFTDSLNLEKENIILAGNQFYAWFTEGVISEAGSTVTISNVTNAIEAMIEAVRGTLTDGPRTSFREAGEFFAQGFVNGILNKATPAGSSRAYAAGKQLATEALNGLNTTLDEASPSKETKRSGKYFTEGFVIGITDKLQKATSAGSMLGKKAVQGLSSSIDMINQNVENGIDSQPVIRPVLDLSDIRSGSGMLGTMLGGTYGLKTNVRAISSSMSSRQNGTTNDVINAISKLGSSLDSMPRGDTYQVDGITYDDGTNISVAVKELINAVKVERRR